MSLFSVYIVQLIATVTNSQSICFWNRVNPPTYTELNGEYIENGTFNNKPYYIMEVDTTCISSGIFYFWYKTGSWAISETLGDVTVPAYCPGDPPTTGTVACDGKWVVDGGIDVNVEVKYGSCPEWDCSSITTSFSALDQCGTNFNQKIGTNAWKGYNDHNGVDVYFYFHPHTFYWVCGPQYDLKCSPLRWDYTFYGWTNIAVDSSQDLMFMDLNEVETINCLSTVQTSNPTTTNPTSSNPTTTIPTTATPTTAIPTTINPTTTIPTTAIPTTINPTTTMPSTLFPTTLYPTTSEPTPSPSNGSGGAAGEHKSTSNTEFEETGSRSLRSNSGDSDMVIIVAIFAALIGVIAIIIGLVFCYRIRAKKEVKKANNMVEMNQMMETNGSINTINRVGSLSVLSAANSDCEVVQDLNLNIVDVDNGNTMITGITNKSGEMELEQSNETDDELWNEGNQHTQTPGHHLEIATPQQPTLMGDEYTDDGMREDEQVEQDDDSDAIYEKGNKTKQ